MKGVVVCDLDGVVYLGDSPTAGAGEALGDLVEAGYELLFVTNNSSREPASVRAKLARVVGFDADERQIITSSLVAASLIEEGPVLIMGERGVEAAVTGAGFELTEDPDEAKAVVVGIDRDLSYERVARAATAVRSGARLIVTNRDPTFPTDHGLLPGAGACVVAVETASGVRGVTGGKPSDAMRRLIEERFPDLPIWMIGDRLETDIALASGSRWTSILVLTGVTAAVEPDDHYLPDYVVPDLAAAAKVIVGSE